MLGYLSLQERSGYAIRQAAKRNRTTSGRLSPTPFGCVLHRISDQLRGDDRSIVGELAQVVLVFGGTTGIQKEIIGRSLGL